MSIQVKDESRGSRQQHLEIEDVSSDYQRTETLIVHVLASQVFSLENCYLNFSQGRAPTSIKTVCRPSKVTDSINKPGSNL